MRAYDRNFDPPAPIAEVVLGHPISSANSGVLQGKLDSGADLTVIPLDVVSQLSLRQRSAIWTRGYEGSFSQRHVSYVNLTIEGYHLSLVRCVATERTTVLVGRNVLNRFVVTLDGKKLAFQMKPI
ncbi:MAG: hypothetical protein JWO95_3330 [Verrucomicrobiales bacterium]|nr:hypothetical protein [Verrucomicrobiales bacterium]